MAIDTKIKNYPASHGKKNGSGVGGTTIIMGGGVGNTSIPSDINVNSINANIGDISILKGKSLSFNDGQFIYLGSSNGTVNKISGDNLKYAYGDFGEIKADKVGTKELTTEDLNAVKGWIGTLNSKSITTEYLNVTRQAHFFELVIDKIRSVGGQMIMTAANCVVDYAKAVDADGNYLENLDDSNAKAYDIFWLGSDASGRSVTNDWKVNDQAICQSFNNVSTGVNYDVSNKYYWRLVTEILPDRYMNLSSGAELSLDESQQATVNAVTITAPYLADTNDTRLDTGWNTQAQQISGVITGASWTETSGGADKQTVGTMTTTNTVFGIQITPVKGSTTEIVNANYFGFSCTPARLNVGIYYTDGTSQYFVAPDKLQTSYRYETLTQAPVEAIVITNAEEVEWKVVHGIRLSNTDCAPMIDGYTSIPSIGDNVIQLGYRYGENAADKSRSSAIIIAAYNTPDRKLTPPSYAQYTDITDYELSEHRQTYIDAKESIFVGNFYVDAHTSIQDIINQTAHTTYHLHIAYANSADGQTDFTKIPLADVSYSYMGYCSNTDASDESLTYADYQWVLVPGGAGTNGGHWEYAYKNSAEQPAAPAPGTTIDQLTDGWATTGTTPDFENGEYTWMSQCFVSGATGQYGTWTNPIRITGENGKAGEDGTEIEFIYKHFENEQTWNADNKNPANWSISDNADYVGPTGFEWSDNPTGVSDTYKYEYVSLRYKTFGKWGVFTVPVIWSKWGEKGQDGDGYEYIYKVFTSEQTWTNDNYNPEHWDTNQTDDYVGPLGYEWSDDPQGVTDTYLYEYVSTRKKINGVWGSFSTPSLWAHWAPAGSNGSHYEFMYKNAPSRPSTPASGTTNLEMISDGWAVTATTPNFENGEYTWMTQCLVSGNGTYNEWSIPSRITGDNGKAGEDGKYTEFIYKHFENEQSWSNNYYDPTKWEISNVPDYTGDSRYGWSDNPQGTTSTYLYEYVSTREFNGTTFTKFSTPVIWAKWGEKGQDGDGYEYIYKVFTSEQTWLNDYANPAYWDANQTDEYLGPTEYKWSDDPQSVTSSNKFQYCAVRKKTNGVWGKFSTPTIWGTYGVGEPGPQGITGPQGPTGPQGNPTQVYRLIDNGSQAYVKMNLDKNTNDIVEQLVISLNYKVAKFVGGTVTFMTYDELLNFPKEFGSINGLYAYVKHYNPNDSPVVQWHRLTLNNDGTFTYSFASTNSNAIENNATIEVRLIPYKASSIVTSSSGLNYTKDSVFVPITLLPKATLNVVQGQQASIRALVTGQEDNKKLITDVQITAAGIQSTVAEHETKITDAQNAITETNNKVAKIEQTARGIQSTVEDHTSKILKNTTDITNANNAISDANDAINSNTNAINANTNAINANTNAITVTTNKISEIEQTAGSIQTTVSSMTKYSEGCNLLTGSNLDGKDTKLYFTCDKYSNLCMLPVNGWPHNSFYCDVETTTKAAYYGLHWGGFGRENIILEVGKEYTASVWVYGHGKISMEIQYYDTINDDYRNGYKDGHIFIVEEAQGWHQISFDFTAKPYNEYENSTVQYDSSKVHYAEVFYILYNTENGSTKVRGGQVYFSCPMLAPKGTLNWQFAKNEIRHKAKNILDGTLDFNIGGNLQIVNADEIGDYDNDIVASSKYISGTSTSSDYLELVQWEIYSDLKDITDYTLSFYARSKSSNAALNVYMYYSGGGPTNFMEDSQGATTINNNNNYDGNTQLTLDSTWTHYWVHWHIRDGWTAPNNKVWLLLRLPSGGNNAQIALPKLELGAAATGYDEGGDMLSRITQTASNINASIVDLTTGLETVGINLNGIDSTITMKGNVEIRPPETAQGGEAEYLKVYDTAGIERVIVESGNIPTISDLSNKLSGLQTYSLAAPTYKQFNYNAITKKHVWTGTVEGTMDIGYIPDGTEMTINAADTLYQSSFNNVIVEKSTGHTLTLNILKDGASVYSKTLTHSVGGTNTNTASYSMTNGTFSIRITESGTITVTGLNRPGGIVSQPNFTQNEGTFGVVGWTVKMKMQAEKPSFTQIGQNGMVLASAFNKYLYYDNSKFAIRNGKEGIILDDKGLHRICLLKDAENEALMTCGFNKRNVYTYSGSGALTLDSQHYNNYDLFVFTYSGPAILNLRANTNTSDSNPWPCIGHTIQVKKINSGDLTIKSFDTMSSNTDSSKPLILSLDGSDLSSSYNCGHTCTTLTWTGNYWVTSR